MNQYLVYLAVISMFVSLANFLMYDSERMRASRLCMGIIVIAATMVPLTSVLKDTFDVNFEETEIYVEDSELAESVAEKAFIVGIKKTLSEKFSLSESGIEIEVAGFEIESMRAERIYVKLSGENAFADTRSIREYVEKNKFGECVVEVDFE